MKTNKKRIKPGKFTSAYPLLDKRCKELGISIPTMQCFDNNVIVWRFPPITTSPTGRIHLAHFDQSPHTKGVLLAMGPRAMDILESNGITLGHVVTWRSYAGDERRDSTKDKVLGQEILLLKVTDIIGSDDLREMLESGKARYIRGEDGKHRLEVRMLSGRKEKLLALAADPGATEAERETARKIAGGIPQ